MKPIIIKTLNVARCYKCGRYLASLACECSQDVPAAVRAGSGELVFTALVSKESIYLRTEGTGSAECWRYSHLRRAIAGLREVLSFEGYKYPFTVTLKIQPVNRAAKIDSASSRIFSHESS